MVRSTQEEFIEYRNSTMANICYTGDFHIANCIIYLLTKLQFLPRLSIESSMPQYRLMIEAAQSAYVASKYSQENKLHLKVSHKSAKVIEIPIVTNVVCDSRIRS